jgi:GTP-binding protein EngB required for normal cell division
VTLSKSSYPAGDGLPAVSLGTLGQVTAICEAFRITTLQPQLRACAGIAQNEGIVDIAVLGQFKAGKSSFLNSLIGAEVLPVDVLPATAVVTRLGYGETNEAQLHLTSGEVRDCPISDLSAYVTERENPGNVKQVEAVEVTLAALAPFGGVRFVDTPGLGSVFAHNTQASMDWLPKVGGALVAIGVNQPFGEQDLKLLLEVSKHTPEVVILLTKADLVSQGQLASILEFTQHHGAQHAGRQLLVLPYSTHPDFEAMRQMVRNHVLRDMAGRHQELFANILDHKVRAITGSCRDYLLLAQRAAQAAVEARSDLLEMLNQEQASLQSVKSEIGVFTRDLKTRARSGASDHFQAFRGEVQRHLQASLRRDMAGWKGNLAKRRARFEQWLEQALHEELSMLSAHGQEFLASHLLEAEASLQRKVRGFQDRLARAIERALGLTFEGARFHAELSNPRQPDVRVGKVFDSQVDLLWFLIPMGVLGPLFDRHFLKLIPWEAEKNLSRLANQWAEAANACIEGLVSQALEFMRKELETLESLTTMAEDRREELESALAILDKIPNGPK